MVIPEVTQGRICEYALNICMKISQSPYHLYTMEKVTKRIKINILKAHTSQSVISTEDSTKTVNRGVGRDRAMARHLRDAKNMSNVDDSKKSDHSWAMVCQQIMDNDDKETDDGKHITSQCRELLGIDTCSRKNRDSLLRDKGKRKPIELIGQENLVKKQNHWYQRSPCVRLGHETSSEVKRRTNFNGEAEMIGYIIVVCNADWDVMTKSASGILTWFEEWFFF